MKLQCLRNRTGHVPGWKERGGQGVASECIQGAEQAPALRTTMITQRKMRTDD